MSSRVEDRRTSTAPSRHGRWSRLCLKELRETLRDRRTLITLILMPLLVYPVLSMVFQRSLLSSLTSSQPRVVVGVPSKQLAILFREQIAIAEAYLDQQTPPPSKDEEMASAEAPVLPLVSRGPAAAKLSVDDLEFREVKDVEAAVRGENVDLAISLLEESGQYSLAFRQGSGLSQRALRFIEERLNALNEMDLRQRLAVSKLPSGKKVRVVRRPLTVQSNGASTLSTIVPMILILMTVTGAVYPAIDLTAGERERGTLEMLMASPVPRFRLLLAKYVAVVVVAFLTALVNLTAMTITLWATGLSKSLLGEAGMDATRILQILALLVLFAAFFSAVLLCLTSFARSFKEAQAYLIPLMLLSLGPGIVSLLPGLELNGLLAITPISNIVLLARDLCGGTVNPAMATAAILSTALYTFAALGVAAKIFGTDAVMSGSNASFQTLFLDDSSGQLLSERRVATVGGAMMCLAVLFPVYFVVLNGLAQLTAKYEFSMGLRLAISGLATSVLFGVIPWIYAKLQRLDLQHSFQIFLAALPAFTVALMLGFTVWPIVHEAVLLMKEIGLAPLSEEQLQKGAAYLTQFKTVHPALILCTVALAPAVFEELFFRGYLFSALKAATSKSATILLSAILFGVFHVVSSNALSLERLVPSTMMGLILGWLCYYSQSVLPGMLLHACHNGTLIMMAYYKDELAEMGFGLGEQEHIPSVFLGGCVAALVVGLFLIRALPQNWHAGVRNKIST